MTKHWGIEWRSLLERPPTIPYSLSRTDSHPLQVSPRDVCIQFGCLKLEKIVRDTLEEYDARRGGDRARVKGEDQTLGSAHGGECSGRRVVCTGLDSGTDGAGQNGRWSPKLVGAAFTLVAEAYGTRVDKKRLIAALGIQQRAYKVALDAMGQEMHDVFFEESDGGEGDDQGGDQGGAQAGDTG